MGEPFEQVHVLARQVNVLNLPLVPHVAVPPPAYPSLHVTVTVCVVVPVMDPLVALLELAMLPAAVQVLAAHVKVLNWPFVPHVTSFVPVYPESQVTVTVCPVVPVILALAALLELATLVAVHVLALQVNALKVPPVLHVAVPPPVNPSLHVTVTVCPVVPIKTREREY